MEPTPLQKAVEELKGKSADQLADLMRSRHIKGRPGTVRHCPISIMLHNTYGGRFLVGRKWIIRECGTSVERLPTPAGAGIFVRKFDLCEYHDMISPPPRVLLEHKKSTPQEKPHRKPRKPSGEKRHPARDVGRFA